VDDRKAFENAIDDALERGELATAQRLVYADWLDEQNTPEDARLAMAQRWMAWRWKRPHHYQDSSSEGWRWYNPDAILVFATFARLDHEIYALVSQVLGQSRFYSFHSLLTRPDAERVLADALAHQPA
jgi:uncharacterized protein (TIGR02996 family)